MTSYVKNDSDCVRPRRSGAAVWAGLALLCATIATGAIVKFDAPRKPDGPARATVKDYRAARTRDNLMRLERDKFYLAATMWAEGRGDGPSGMEAVGNVILNRIGANPNRWGRDPTEVALRSKQFSCWNAHDVNRRYVDKQYLAALNPTSPDGAAWKTAQALSNRLLTGPRFDLTGGATHYHAVRSHGRRFLPYWTASMTLVQRIGRQVYYQ